MSRSDCDRMFGGGRSECKRLFLLENKKERTLYLQVSRINYSRNRREKLQALRNKEKVRLMGRGSIYIAFVYFPNLVWPPPLPHSRYDERKQMECVRIAA